MNKFKIPSHKIVSKAVHKFAEFCRPFWAEREYNYEVKNQVEIHSYPFSIVIDEVMQHITLSSKSSSNNGVTKLIPITQTDIQALLFVDVLPHTYHWQDHIGKV